MTLTLIKYFALLAPGLLPIPLFLTQEATLKGVKLLICLFVLLAAVEKLAELIVKEFLENKNAKDKKLAPNRLKLLAIIVLATLTVGSLELIKFFGPSMLRFGALLVAALIAYKVYSEKSQTFYNRATILLLQHTATTLLSFLVLEYEISFEIVVFSLGIGSLVTSVLLSKLIEDGRLSEFRKKKRPRQIFAVLSALFAVSLSSLALLGYLSSLYLSTLFLIPLSYPIHSKLELNKVKLKRDLKIRIDLEVLFLASLALCLLLRIPYS